MFAGTIRKWVGDRGFGFAVRDDGGADAFIHASQCPDGAEDFEPGDRVQFDLEPDPKTGRERAINVRRAE